MVTSCSFRCLKLEISRNCTYALVCQVMLDNSWKKGHWDPQKSELNAQYGIWCSTFLPLLQDKHPLLIRLARITITVLIGICVCAYMCVCVCYTKENHLCWHHMLQFDGALGNHLGIFVLWNKLLLTPHYGRYSHLSDENTGGEKKQQLEMQHLYTQTPRTHSTDHGRNLLCLWT